MLHSQQSRSMKRPPRGFLQPKTKSAKKQREDCKNVTEEIKQASLGDDKDITEEQAAASGAEIEETLISLCSRFIMEEMADVTGMDASVQNDDEGRVSSEVPIADEGLQHIQEVVRIVAEKAAASSGSE